MLGVRCWGLGTRTPERWKKVVRGFKGRLPSTRSCCGSIFGSHVREQEREDSDLDVLVEFSRVPSLFEFVALKIEVSDLLGIGVDLVMRRALGPRIGDRILQEVIQV